MGSGTISRGYCSTAMGEGTEAKAFGEVAMGLYTENDGPYTSGYPVTPSALEPKPYLWQQEARNVTQMSLNRNDSVLRVGIGYCEVYDTTEFTPFTTCHKAVRMDGLRLHRDGTLYLRKADGSTIPDVAAAITELKLQVQQAGGRRLEQEAAAEEMASKRAELMEAELKVTKEQLFATQRQLDATQELLAALTARVEQLEK